MTRNERGIFNTRFESSDVLRFPSQIAIVSGDSHFTMYQLCRLSALSDNRMGATAERAGWITAARGWMKLGN